MDLRVWTLAFQVFQMFLIAHFILLLHNSRLKKIYMLYEKYNINNSNNNYNNTNDIHVKKNIIVTLSVFKMTSKKFKWQLI